MKPSPKRPSRAAVGERGIGTLHHHARLATAYAELARDLTRARDAARRLADRFHRRAAAVARRLGRPLVAPLAAAPRPLADDVRRLALALPYVEEIDCDGFDFRVGGKGFVWSYPERQPGKPRVIRTDIAVLFVGDEDERQALLLGEPDLFFTAPGYRDQPLVMLRLAQVGVERLSELVTDAWRMRAPEEILSVLDEAGQSPNPGPG
jgi:hypothetical protein